jgi:hypothetical protein
VIDLRGSQLVEHVHGGGEQDTTIGLACPPADDFRQECFAGARIADQNDVSALVDEVEIQETEDARFILLPRLVMLEQEGVDGVLPMQAGEVEPTLHGAAVARFQFQVGEPFHGSRGAEALFSGMLESLIELTAHGGKAESFQFLGECHELSFSGSSSRNASYSSSES